MSNTKQFSHQEAEVLLNIAEAAHLLKIQASTLYAWVHQRRIPFRKHGRRTIFSKLALLSWSASQETLADTQLTSYRTELKAVSVPSEPEKLSKRSLKTKRNADYDPTS